MISARCFTDIKAFAEATWPKVFVSRPMLGDIVRSTNSPTAELKVIRVTHSMKPTEEFLLPTPLLEVELGAQYHNSDDVPFRRGE